MVFQIIYCICSSISTSLILLQMAVSRFLATSVICRYHSLSGSPPHQHFRKVWGYPTSLISWFINFYTNIFFLFKLRDNKMGNAFSIVFIFKFVNWLIANDYYIVISYQVFIAKYLYVIDLTLQGLLQINQKQPAICSVQKDVLKNFVNFTGKDLCWSLCLIRENIIKNILKRDSNTGAFLWNIRDF